MMVLFFKGSIFNHWCPVKLLRFSFAATSWSPFGRNDKEFVVFCRGGGWWRRSRHQTLPDICNCHSERSEEP